MGTAASILSNIRKMFGDPDADYITDAVGLDWLNRGERRFCHKVMPLDEFKDYTITAKQPRFDLPTDTIWPNYLMWYQSGTRKLSYAPPDLWCRLEESYPNSTGSPDFYTVQRRQLIVGPQVPSTASAATTASGVMDAADTTIGLASAAGYFRSKGYLKCESEIMEYTNTATTTCTGVIRGVHGTTAATHASGTAVTQIDLVMFYRKTAPAMATTSSSPSIPVMFHDYLEKYALYLAYVSRGDTQKAQLALAEFEDMESDASKTIGRRAQDGLLHIQEKIDRHRYW